MPFNTLNVENAGPCSLHETLTHTYNLPKSPAGSQKHARHKGTWSWLPWNMKKTEQEAQEEQEK